MESIDATTLRKKLKDVLGRVEFAGERFKVTKNRKIIAEIGPPSDQGRSVPPLKRKRHRA